MIGKIFNKLTVISFDHQGASKLNYYNCQCNCGLYIIVSQTKLEKGMVKDCGCNKGIEETAKNVWKSYQDGCSFEKFLKLSQQNCYYCNKVPSNRQNAYLRNNGKLTRKSVPLEQAVKYTFIYNGLDRIDTSSNHSEDNIVSCCKECNIAKNDYTFQEFVDKFELLEKSEFYQKIKQRKERK